MKIKAGPSGHEVISLQKMDSLLVLANVREAKKVSARWHLQDYYIPAYNLVLLLKL
jgi:hypothetical protein